MKHSKYLMQCIVIFFLFTTTLIGQVQYNDVQEVIKNTVALYNESQKDKDLLNTILANFNQSDKVNSEELKKTNLGICVVLNPEYSALLVAPAKYTYRNGKINLSAFRLRGTNKISNDMDAYVYNYQNDIKTLGESPFFLKLLQNNIDTDGTLTENETEHIIDEATGISFVRGNKDWMYIVSIDKRYNSVKQPQVIVYLFQKTLNDNDSRKTPANKESNPNKLTKNIENYPLYHDKRIDELRTALAELIVYEPFKSDQKLLKYTYNMVDRLDRYTIRDYEEELLYFATLNISESFLNTNFDSYYDKDSEVKNITHLAAHSLGDIYLSSNNYELAKEYYTQAIFRVPIKTNSGTTASKDVNRIVYDLSKNAYNTGKKDEAYAYLISMLFEDPATATKLLNNYITSDNQDKKKLKEDIDKALNTITKGENYTYTFDFRRNKVFFMPMFSESIQIFQNDIKNTDFYKSL